LCLLQRALGRLLPCRPSGGAFVGTERSSDQREGEAYPRRFLEVGLSHRRTSDMPPDVVIAVMGVTGVGKSSLIRLATGDESITVGDDLTSCKATLGVFFFFRGFSNCI
jgi:hypothetical protein